MGPAAPPGLGHPRHCEDRGRLPHGVALRPCHPEDVEKGPLHDLAQARLDLLPGPEESLQVLDPLEVRDHDAAGVGHDVGNDQDAALVSARSAIGVVGPLAASAMTRARTSSTLDSLRTPCSAAGTG